MGHRGGCRDALFRAAEVRGQRPLDARQARLSGLDAWDGVRRGAMADARRGLPQKRDVGAGKWADRAPGGRARDDLQLDARAPLLACWLPAVAGLCKSDAGQSAA